MQRHLAQLNIATLRYPIDDPRIADFVDALPAVNGAGERATGYVWRLQSEGGDATDIRVFDDPLIIVNLTVWKSMSDLKVFAYRGVHRDFFRRRGEWFVEGASRTALWWLPANVLPTTDDAKDRLDFIDAFGTSPHAFEMGQNHPALVIERAGLDDGRAEPLLAGATWDPRSVVGGDGAFVIAELDDLPVACGAFHRIDASMAEVTRMHVEEPARGKRVGAAIVAELASIARGEGLERLLFETSPRNLASLPMYEGFGFRRTERWGDHLAPSAICLEKSLTREPSRLA